jgi:hypothetical protein
MREVHHRSAEGPLLGPLWGPRLGPLSGPAYVRRGSAIWSVRHPHTPMVLPPSRDGRRAYWGECPVMRVHLDRGPGPDVPNKVAIATIMLYKVVATWDWMGGSAKRRHLGYKPLLAPVAQLSDALSSSSGASRRSLSASLALLFVGDVDGAAILLNRPLRVTRRVTLAAVRPWDARTLFKIQQLSARLTPERTLMLSYFRPLAGGRSWPSETSCPA